MKYKFLLAITLTCHVYAGDRTAENLDHGYQRMTSSNAVPPAEREVPNAQQAAERLLESLLEKPKHAPPRLPHSKYNPKQENRRNIDRQKRR